MRGIEYHPVRHRDTEREREGERGGGRKVMRESEKEKKIEIGRKRQEKYRLLICDWSFVYTDCTLRVHRGRLGAHGDITVTW